MGKLMRYYIVFAFVVLSNLCFAQLDSTEHYYYDLGMTYYALCLITNDRTLKENQILAGQKALEINPRFNSGHWLIATAYSDIGNCDKAKKHFKKYRKYTPKAEIDYRQIGNYLENCP